MCDILERLLAAVPKRVCKLAANVLVHCTRDANSAGLCQVLQSSSDIDAITIDTEFVEDDVAEVDTDAIEHTTGFLDVGIPLRHFALHAESTLDRANNARKLCKYTIPGRIDNAAAVLCDNRVYDCLMPFEVAHCALFINAHKDTVSGDISRKDCSKLS
jgi:hypothetical protein